MSKHLSNDQRNIWYIRCDPNLVCNLCGTNDSVHYNWTCFHDGEAIRDDHLGSIGVWCESCGSEVEMVEPVVKGKADA